MLKIMTATNIEKEYNSIEQRNGWHEEFMNIKEHSDFEAREKQFTFNSSKKNRKYNRYRDVNPYDHSRIVLQRVNTISTDYINANLVKCDRAKRKYILTQGPLPQTVSHFWLMAWEQNTKAVLMLNKIIEKKQVKCHKYWPENIGEQHVMEMEDVGLSLEYTRCEEFDNFCIRTLRLTELKTNESKEIYQFHYKSWPDFGIPSSPNAFLQFLRKVRECGAMDDNVGPPIVHCSAGIGRSGTFCLVDSCLVLVDKFGEEKISVKDVLHELRSYRMGLIQTTDQLYFSYQAIIEGIKLFNDPEWCKAKMESVIKLNDTEDGCSEDAPPPLPPPRTDSLHQQIPAKPLPMIPNNERLVEEIEVRKEEGFGQPLPQAPLEEVESNSSNSSISNSSVTDVESYDDSPVEEAENLADNVYTNKENDGEDYKSQNGLFPDSEETILRKRRREEKSTEMAERVKEIKRKQKEVEEGVTTKKRRSLIVKITLAAMLIGFVCIYTYSKK